VCAAQNSLKLTAQDSQTITQIHHYPSGHIVVSKTLRYAAANKKHHKNKTRENYAVVLD
jgi:hypothetical protein